MRQRPWFFAALSALIGCSGGGSTHGDAAPGADSGNASDTGSSTGHDATMSGHDAVADTHVNPTDTGTTADVGHPDTGTPTDSGSTGTLTLYGQPYTGGQYNLGPVDYAETQWHNACAPSTPPMLGYAPAVQSVEGNLLAGLWDGIPNTAGYCDACIYVTTAMGRSALLRVVTYGSTTPNSIDVSPEAYSILNAGEYPRAMTWQFAKCADTGPMLYEFQSGSSEWWTSLWVRNARVPITRVEVQSANHASYMVLARGTDGTLTDGNGGFGVGPFSIRSTGVDGQVVVETFQWPSAGIASAFLTGTRNFQ